MKVENYRILPSDRDKFYRSLYWMIDVIDDKTRIAVSECGNTEPEKTHTGAITFNDKTHTVIGKTPIETLDKILAVSRQYHVDGNSDGTPWREAINPAVFTSAQYAMKWALSDKVHLLPWLFAISTDKDDVDLNIHTSPNGLYRATFTIARSNSRIYAQTFDELEQQLTSKLLLSQLIPQYFNHESDIDKAASITL